MGAYTHERNEELKKEKEHYGIGHKCKHNDVDSALMCDHRDHRLTIKLKNGEAMKCVTEATRLGAKITQKNLIRTEIDSIVAKALETL